MTLYSLAMRNIRRNAKTYLLYLYPMVFSIVIYFTFVSLQYNKQISDSMTVYGKIEPAFQAASILLFFFAAAFISFSNAFFTRSRKKEVALYSLFGIEKKQIGKLLFYENIILGIASLCIGLLLGILLSKLFAMILIKLMGTTIIAKLSLSIKAILQTIIGFMIIIVFTSIHNYRLIYRYSLFQLMKAEKKADKRPKKVSWLAALMAIFFIGAGYTIILQPSDASFWDDYGFQAIIGSFVLMLIGTYLFVQAFIMFILQKLTQMKGFYFKGINLISITHLFYRIKGNVLILSVIAMLSTFTLFALGTTFSLYSDMNNISKKNFPYSIMYTVPDAEKEEAIEKLMIENGQEQISSEERIDYLEINGDLSEIRRVPNDFPIILLSESTYQLLAEKRGLKTTQFSENEAITFYDGNLDQSSDPFTGKKVSLAGNKTVKIAAYEDYTLLNLDIYVFPMVVKDALYQQLEKDGLAKELQIYSLKNEKSAKELDQKLSELFYIDPYADFAAKGENIFSSFYHNYHKFFQVYGLLIFISAFLGFVFLLATGSMLHYKLLTEATADQPRYQILKKIGMSKSKLRKSIANQLIFIYLIPFIIAISHSTIIIIALSSFLGMSMMNSLMMTIGAYLAMYLIYYFVTLSKYTEIVSKG
ncbi:FtsX-like permease family protein [Cytobacillus dafuensis]|uniref:FtsX-like permease family protein n=1 Tax=Cytobacillus dafuensis TaxID=1742359 RepID=A0A5B8Z0N8_CYTDA|nr:FtsX-like permease family protein [Cytobacillus dafuensis]QED46532.1 FtsX-like permease family protein [Cytobacillus dafuensis]